MVTFVFINAQKLPKLQPIFDFFTIRPGEIFSIYAVSMGMKAAVELHQMFLAAQIPVYLQPSELLEQRDRLSIWIRSRTVEELNRGPATVFAFVPAEVMQVARIYEDEPLGDLRSHTYAYREPPSCIILQVEREDLTLRSSIVVFE